MSRYSTRRVPIDVVRFPDIADEKPERDDEPTLVTKLMNDLRSTVDKAGESFEHAADTAQAMVNQARKRSSKANLKQALSKPPPPPPDEE